MGKSQLSCDEARQMFISVAVRMEESKDILSEADRAIKSLNGKLVNGRNIKVNPADPGGKRPKRLARRNRY